MSERLRMDATVEYEWDSRDLALFRGGKVEGALARALNKAGSEAVRRMKAEANRKARQRKKLKVSAVNKALPLIFPKNTKIIEFLVWEMRVSGTPMPLSSYPHRQTKKGVMVQVTPGKRKLIKSAFLGTMSSGHEGIFQRRTKARLPIDELFSSRISDVFEDTGFIQQVLEHGRGAFARAYARTLLNELGKLK